MSLYNFFEKLFGVVGKIRIHPVEFQKPWHSVYQHYWLRLSLSLLYELLIWVFFASLPLLIAYLINSQNFILAIAVCVFFLLNPILAQIHLVSYTKALAGLMASIASSAYEFFLKVDPVFHSTRESGKVIAKVNRCVSAFEVITDTLVFSIAPFFIQTVVVFFSFANFDLQIGLVAGLSLLLVIIVSIISQAVVAKSVTPVETDQLDVQSQIEVESLQQVHLVRAAFATPEQIQKIRTSNTRTAEVQATVWSAFVATSFVPRILYAISLFIIFSMVFNSVQNASIDLINAIALMTIYLSTYGNLVNAGRHIERLVSNIEIIRNLFTYIRGYGKSNFPI